MRHSRSTACCLLLIGFLLAGTKTPAHAELQKKDVNYEHDGVQLKGYLIWDNAISGKRPGVLVIHEWWGLNDYARSRSEMLAKMGYVAFALDMYGEGKFTEEPTQAMEWSGTVRSDKQKWRDRAMAGLDVLKAQPQVDPERMAAIGYCFGGSTAIQLAYAGAPVKGVVSFHGALSPPDADIKVVPHVLVCTGAADTGIPAAQVDAFVFGMEAAKAKYTVIAFGGARHGFTNPDADKRGIPNLAYDATADRVSWANMKMFFDELFEN